MRLGCIFSSDKRRRQKVNSTRTRTSADDVSSIRRTESVRKIGKMLSAPQNSDFQTAIHAERCAEEAIQTGLIGWMSSCSFCGFYLFRSLSLVFWFHRWPLLLLFFWSRQTLHWIWSTYLAVFGLFYRGNDGRAHLTEMRNENIQIELKRQFYCATLNAGDWWE